MSKMPFQNWHFAICVSLMQGTCDRHPYDLPKTSRRIFVFIAVQGTFTITATEVEVVWKANCSWNYSKLWFNESRSLALQRTPRQSNHLILRNDKWCVMQLPIVLFISSQFVIQFNITIPTNVKMSFRINVIVNWLCLIHEISINLAISENQLDHARPQANIFRMSSHFFEFWFKQMYCREWKDQNYSWKNMETTARKNRISVAYPTDGVHASNDSH